MSVRLEWSGLDDLIRELHNLPEDLTGEAQHIIEGAANGAAAEIKGRYAVRTGNLRDHLEVIHADPGPFAAWAILKNTAKHAGIVETGTQARHTAIGANRGAMPPEHNFIPTVIRKRRQMYEQLKDLVARNGFEVSGDA